MKTKWISSILFFGFVLISMRSLQGGTSYLIKKEYALAPMCDKISFTDSVSEQDRLFYKGLCVYIKNDTQENKIGPLKKAHEVSFLPEVKVLLEVLLAMTYAQDAKNNYDQYQKNIQNRSNDLKEKICSKRRKAIDIFNAVDWKYISFSYDDLSGIDENAKKMLPTEESLIEKMIGFYGNNKILSGSLNQFCGIIDGISQNDIKTLVNTNFNKIVDSFFGAEDPIKAMFSRKNQRIKLLKDEAQGKIEFYNKTKEPLNQEYRLYRDSYEIISDEIKTMITQYESNVLKIKNELDQFKVFKSGLTTSENGDDVSKSLLNEVKKIENRINNIESKKIIKKIKDLTKGLSNLELDAVANKKTMESMCKVYYCFYRQIKKQKWINACSYADFKMGNPLCQKTPLFTIGINQFNLEQECSKSGLDSKFMKLEIPFDDVRSCMLSFKN